MSCSLLTWELVGWSSRLMCEEYAHQGWIQNSLPSVCPSTFPNKHKMVLLQRITKNVLNVLHITTSRSPSISGLGPLPAFSPLKLLFPKWHLGAQIHWLHWLLLLCCKSPGGARNLQDWKVLDSKPAGSLSFYSLNPFLLLESANLGRGQWDFEVL